MTQLELARAPECPGALPVAAAAAVVVAVSADSCVG